ncbi:MAG: hypothetical protein U5K54_04150 [Cytophagales bacterium]|nr:hypothetical protein [Cytophagales bacterium]
MEELKEIEDQLVNLSLSKMPVADDQLKIVERFKNLEKLNLNFTDITGATLTDLMSLKNLKSLSLSGTSVTSEQIKPLLDLPSLHELFIWNTKVTEEEAVELAGDHPKVEIVSRCLQIPVCYDLPNLCWLMKELSIGGARLKHSMPGVSTYTLNGTLPDTVKWNSL